MSDKEQEPPKYRVTRRIGEFGQQLYLAVSEMRAGDIITVTHPQIGTIQLSEDPNGELMGMTFPQWPKKVGGVPRRISTANIRPDEQGRVYDESCPLERGRGYKQHHVEGIRMGERGW